MATDEEHYELYGKLREAILTRFFAFRRYHRANLLCETNKLGYLKRFTSQGSADKDDDPLPLYGPPLPDPPWFPMSVVKPTIYTDAEDLREKESGRRSGGSPWPGAEVERWRVASHEGENPLLRGTHLMIALAVEYALGLRESLPIMKLYLATLGSLFKFEGAFAGYPLRWDPTTSDNWEVGNLWGVNNERRALRCCDFLLDENGQYLYCTPFDHPEYVPWNPTELQPDAEGNDDDQPRKISRAKYRFWEPSQDELVGLLATYSTIHMLVDDATLRAEIERQVRLVGAYLAEHGYFLVRPAGGFTARGWGDALIAFEYPLGNAFQRMVGDRFESRASFREAMEKAGDWDCMDEAVDDAVIVATVAAALAGIVALSPLLPPFFPLGLIMTAPVWGGVLDTYLTQHCHDVSNKQARELFPLAYLLKELPAKLRFQTWMQGPAKLGELLSSALELLGQEGVVLTPGGHGRGFPQILALMALDGADPVLREAYRDFVRDAVADAGDSPGERGNTGFARAVALAIGEVQYAPELREWLDKAHDDLVNVHYSKPILQDIKNNSDVVVEIQEHLRRPPGRPGEPAPQEPMGPLEYMACLALAWYARRNIAGAEGLPGLVGDAFPEPLVRKEILQAGPIPSIANLDVPIDRDYRPFAEPITSEQRLKSPVFPPLLPPDLPPDIGVETFSIEIPESAALVECPVVLRPRERVRLVPAGRIKPSRAIFSPVNVWVGPGGLPEISTDPKFPLRGSHPFCLLYRTRTPVPGDRPWRRLSGPVGFVNREFEATIEFRTNDDNPGNGEGAFRCSVEIGHLQEPQLGVYPSGTSRWEVRSDAEERGTETLLLKGRPGPLQLHIDSYPWGLTGGDIHATDAWILGPSGRELWHGERIDRILQDASLPRRQRDGVEYKRLELSIDTTEVGLFRVLFGSHAFPLFQRLSDQLPEAMLVKSGPSIHYRCGTSRGIFLNLSSVPLEITIENRRPDNQPQPEGVVRVAGRELQIGDKEKIYTFEHSHSAELSVGPGAMAVMEASGPALFGPDLAELEMIRGALR